jgi:hypothetical protein
MPRPLQKKCTYLQKLLHTNLHWVLRIHCEQLAIIAGVLVFPLFLVARRVIAHRGLTAHVGAAVAFHCIGKSRGRHEQNVTDEQ